MFRDTRRKKLRNKIIFAAAGVMVLSFGIWLNYQSEENQAPSEEAVKKVEVPKTKNNDNQENKADHRNNNERTDTENDVKTYLIKEVEGVVKVFVCDERGNEELYLITSIPFDLLSEGDQQLFVDGVTVDTEEALGEFLQNFDS